MIVYVCKESGEVEVYDTNKTPVALQISAADKENISSMGGQNLYLSAPEDTTEDQMFELLRKVKFSAEGPERCVEDTEE